MPPPALATLNMGFEVVEGFSRPNWAGITQFLEENIPEGDLSTAWNCVAEKWLQQLSSDLGGKCCVSRSENFLCLSELDAPTTESFLSYAESVLGTIRVTLKEAAWTGYVGKHVLLLFSELDHYFTYISYYYGEGSHSLSSGIFLSNGYPHIALPYTTPSATQHALVHELVHNLLCHLSIPSWLNEGLAMIIETRFLRHPFRIDQELVGRHAAHWNEQTIQSFWAGASFDEPGEGSELSYSLAEILIHLLAEKRLDLASFVTNADWHDAGQEAALRWLQMDLGDLAASFLGSGNWHPQPKIISDLLRDRAEA